MADTTTPTPIDPLQLPAVVRRYLDAHARHDVAATLACFTPDAVVTDDGRTSSGHGEISTWLDRSSTEYSYTSTPTGARRIDDEHWEVTQHVQGNFPGGVVDLVYSFVLADGLIAGLGIAAT